MFYMRGSKETIQNSNNKQLYRKSNSLETILEKIQKGFAYRMIELQILLEVKITKTNINMSYLIELLQLYMSATEILESQSDNRYKYFNDKIQILMKKRQILEQLQKASQNINSNNRNNNNNNNLNQYLQPAIQTQIQQRKNEYDINIMMCKQQYNDKKIKDIIIKAQNNLKKISSTVKKNINNQQQQIKQRIKLRKMKSQNGSINNRWIQGQFKKQQQKQIQNQDQDQYLLNDWKDNNNNNNRKGSVQKYKQKSLHNSKRIFL